ncbi:hypothetical protein BpHYR1_021763 [Brachionus plicatilis]|uniref:Uncharacterized protein n=1 Tax=Brachionus plicatilis TaxID=10195 RepID=A0A3M7QX77_BRAPC|nr:hypothetical protein BpHYR1_021763 [Brachionus plicatilis]
MFTICHEKFSTANLGGLFKINKESSFPTSSPTSSVSSVSCCSGSSAAGSSIGWSTGSSSGVTASVFLLSNFFLFESLPQQNTTISTIGIRTTNMYTAHSHGLALARLAKPSKTLSDEGTLAISSLFLSTQFSWAKISATLSSSVTKKLSK